MRISGGLDTSGVTSCTGHIDRTFPISARGTLVCAGPGAALRLTLDTIDDGPHDIVLTCKIGDITTTSRDEAGGLPEYGSALGEFDLPTGGGTKTVTGGDPGGGGLVSEKASATFTVVRAKS
jgi:hypothetical protein